MVHQGSQQQRQSRRNHSCPISRMLHAAVHHPAAPQNQGQGAASRGQLTKENVDLAQQHGRQEPHELELARWRRNSPTPVRGEGSCLPARAIGIDLRNQILKAAAHQWQIKDLPGLGHRVQAVQALPESGQFAKYSVADIRAWSPFRRPCNTGSGRRLRKARRKSQELWPARRNCSSGTRRRNSTRDRLAVGSRIDTPCFFPPSAMIPGPMENAG